MIFTFSSIKKITKIIIFYKSLLGKKNLFKVFISGLAISTLELGGLALLFPFIKLSIEKVYTFEKIISIGTLLILIYFIRGYVISKLIKFQAFISAKINSTLSKKIIEKTLNSNYKLFLEYSSVKIAGSSYTNTMHAALLFQSLTNGLNEIFFLIIILVGLIILNPLISIALLFIIFIFLNFILKPISKEVSNLGSQTQQMDSAHHKFIYAMANSIKDIKIMGLENKFIERNRKISKKHSNSFAQYTYISSIQKILIEIILASCVVITIIIFSLKGIDLQKNAPLILTMGMVSIRIAPALSRLSNSFNGYKYSQPFVEKLFEIIDISNHYPQIRNQISPSLPGEYSINNVFFKYDDKEILKGCKLSIKKGEIVTIVGKSGAGKSTFLDIISGLIVPEKGEFKINKKSFIPHLSKNFTSYIGYVPQFISLIDDSLIFNISLEEKPDMKRLKNATEKAQLHNFIQSLPEGLETKIGEGGKGISGGQRQRIGIARALYKMPSILILDEITSSLDKKTSLELINELYLMKNEVSMLFVSHNSDLIKSDKTYEIKDGKLFLK
jgi:ABC-type bacteriocin/lantibiotic exporter with double-glycine peptidase domain